MERKPEDIEKKLKGKLNVKACGYSRIYERKMSKKRE